MMDRRTAQREAQRFAKALDGPLGSRPVQAVVRENIGFFMRLRTAGASWSQIAALLATAGVRSAKGGQVAANALRAMVSRAEAEAPGQSLTDAALPHRRPSAENAATVMVSPPGEKDAVMAPPAADGMETARRLADVRNRIGRAAALRGVGYGERRP